ncbi:MAG: murein biosynthesis integral membrane protein MurJ [Microthrixaceae bacterium]
MSGPTDDTPSGPDRPADGAPARRDLADEVAFASAALDDRAVDEMVAADISRGDAGGDGTGGRRGEPVSRDPGLARRRGRSLLRASALPAIGTTASRATGLIRVAALTSALGLSSVADIYNLANTTPNILYELVLGGVLSSTLVPIFVRSLDDPDDDTASVVTTVAFVAIVALTLLGVLLAPWINRLFAWPLEGVERAQQLALGDDFLALLLPQVLFYGVTTLITALLHARRRFAPPAFTPVLTNLVTAAAALASVWWVSATRPTSQVYVLGLGTTLGVAVMAIALVPYLRSSGIHLQWSFKPRHPAVRQVMRLSGWTVGFAAANQIAYLAILTLARALEAGAVSAFNYAFIFFQLPHGLIAVSLMTALLPELAEAAVDRDEPAFRRRFREGLSLLLTFLIPATAGVVFLATPLIQLFLQRGNFNAADTARTADMLKAFAVGLPPFSIYLFAVRAFFARKDTRTPFWINLFQNVLNVAIMFPLAAWLGPPGLALAYSLSYWVVAVMALWILHRRVGRLLGVLDLLPLLRSLAVGAVVLLALWGAFELLRPASQTRPLFEMVVGLVVGVAAFVPATFVLRPQGFEPAITRLRQGVRGRGRTVGG